MCSSRGCASSSRRVSPLLRALGRARQPTLDHREVSREKRSATVATTGDEEQLLWRTPEEIPRSPSIRDKFEAAKLQQVPQPVPVRYGCHMARTGDPDDHAGHDHSSTNLDIDLIATCSGMMDEFTDVWHVAERYVRRGDNLFVHAGLALIREFTYRLPLLEAAALIEWYFDRSGYTPRTGNGPMLDFEAFRATVAVGLTSDYLGEESTDSERRQRMMAVIARAAAVAPSPRDRSLVERAFRALDQRNADWWTSPSSRHDAVLRGRAMDPELVERCIEAFEAGRNDEAIRAAMIVLESRLRTSANQPETSFGINLVQAAIGDNTELNFGQTSSDKKGLTEFFTAPMRLFRNPTAHHFIEYEPERTLEILSAVDLALDLLAEANTRLYQPAQYMTPAEEGEGLRVERVLHLDLDGDGEDERVLVCSTWVRNFRRLTYLLLKRANDRWLRLPISPVHPQGAVSDDQRLLELYSANFANDGRRQAVIVAAAAAGGDMATMHILRWDDGQASWLTCAEKRERGLYAATEVMFEIVAGLPELRDVDGDGRPEIYVRRQTLLDPYGAPVSVSHLDVYAYDAADSTLLLREQKALGETPLSSVAYNFIQGFTVDDAGAESRAGAGGSSELP